MEMKPFNPHTFVFVDGKDNPEKRRLLKTLNRVLKAMGVKSQLYNNGEVLNDESYEAGELVEYLNNLSRDNLADLTKLLGLYRVTPDMLDNRAYIKNVKPKLKSYLIVNRETYSGLYVRAKTVTNAALTAGLTREEGIRMHNAGEMCRPIYANAMSVVSMDNSQDSPLIETRAAFLAEAALRIHYGRTSDKRTISTHGEFMLLYRKNNDGSHDFAGGHFARYNIN